MSNSRSVGFKIFLIYNFSIRSGVNRVPFNVSVNLGIIYLFYFED
jgi:hypothetical protein